MLVILYKPGFSSDKKMLKALQQTRNHFSPVKRQFHTSNILKMGSNPSSLKLHDFNSVNTIIASPDYPKNITLVDVREFSELQKSGKIPGAINVPFNSQPSAFKYDQATWEESFANVPKPALDQELVFYCAAGRRAKAAADVAAEAGYENLGVYTGSFTDWQNNKGKTEAV